MANNIQVSLNTTQSQPRLSVDDNGGQNQVNQSPNPQTISFNLTGNLTQGNFQAMDADPPGFKWIDDPPSNVFSTPQVTNNGNQLQFIDTHTGTTTKGQWIYQIAVNYNGSVVTTTDVIEGPGGTINNPVIINKGP